MAFSQSQKKWLSKINSEPAEFLKAEEINFQVYIGEHERDGRGVMHYAVRSNHKELILSLVSHGGSFFDKKTHNHQTPFDWICENAKDPKTYELAMICLRVEPEKFLTNVQDRHANELLAAAYSYSNEKFIELLSALPNKKHTPNKVLLKHIAGNDDDRTLKLLAEKWQINWRGIGFETGDGTITNVATYAASYKAPKCLAYFLEQKVCTTGIPKTDTVLEKYKDSYAPAAIAGENGCLSCLKVLYAHDPESLWRPQTKNERFPLAAAAESPECYQWIIQQPDVFAVHIDMVMNNYTRSSRQLPISAALLSKTNLTDKKNMVLNAIELYEISPEKQKADFQYIAEIEATTFYEQYDQWQKEEQVEAWIYIGQRMKQLGMDKPRSHAVTYQSLAFMPNYADNVLKAGLNLEVFDGNGNILTIFARTTAKWMDEKEAVDKNENNIFIENMKVFKNNTTKFCEQKSEQKQNYLQIVSSNDASQQSWHYDILSDDEINKMNKPSSSYSGTLGKDEWPAHVMLRWARDDNKKFRNILKRLINNGMHVDALGETQLSVLHIAASKGFHETCKMLLNDFQAKITPTGDGSLWHILKNEDTAKILIAHGLSLTDHKFLDEIFKEDGDCYNTNGLKFYLAAGGNTDFCFDNSNNILTEAIMQQRWELAEIIVDAKPNLAVEVNKQKKQAIDYLTPKAAAKIPEHWDGTEKNADKIHTLARLFCKLYAVSEIDQPSKAKASVRHILEDKYTTWWDNNPTLRSTATEFRLKNQTTSSPPAAKTKI